MEPHGFRVKKFGPQCGKSQEITRYKKLRPILYEKLTDCETTIKLATSIGSSTFSAMLYFLKASQQPIAKEIPVICKKFLDSIPVTSRQILTSFHNVTV